MFCIVGAERSVQTFSCEPDSSCSDREGTKGRNHHSGNNELGPLKVKTYILQFQIGTEEINTHKSMEIK